MKTNIVRIGNSKGMRLPKPILDQSGLEGAVEIEVEGHRLVIRTAHAARGGWIRPSLPGPKKATIPCWTRGVMFATEWDKTAPRGARATIKHRGQRWYQMVSILSRPEGREQLL